MINLSNSIREFHRLARQKHLLNVVSRENDLVIAVI